MPYMDGMGIEGTYPPGNGESFGDFTGSSSTQMCDRW